MDEEIISPITLSIPKHLWDDFKILARVKGVNLNDYIVILIRREIVTKREGLDAVKSV